MANNKREPIEGMIPDINVDWDNGVSAYSTTQVEELLKRCIRALQGGKMGAVMIDDDTLRFFATTEDRAAYRKDRTKTELILDSVALGSVVVDSSLSAESKNPVENQAVTAKINEVLASMIGDIRIVESGGINTLYLYNKSGDVIANAEFTAGGGQGEGDATASYMTLKASVAPQLVKEGDTVTLTWMYNHTTSDGAPDGLKADVTIVVSVGSITTYTETIRNVSAGSYTLDLSDYLMAGTVEINLVAECDLGDRVQKGRAYTSVTVATLALETSYNIAEAAGRGGHATTETIEIPWTVTGSGEKEVLMYVDGSTKAYASETVTKGSKSGAFTLSANSLSAGRHTVQLVAERGDLRSASIHLDILKAGEDRAFVGVKAIDRTGTIRTGSAHLTPRLNVTQYEQWSVQYVAYDPAKSQTEVTVEADGAVTQRVTVGRTVSTLTGRFGKVGNHNIKLSASGAALTIGITAERSDIEASEAEGSMLCRLTAEGRSNAETTPGMWEDSGVSTVFDGVDWRTSGWQDNALVLKNGSKATIGINPFADESAAQKGKTLEITFTVRNINSRTASIIRCKGSGKGFEVTGESIGYLTGSTVSYENEDGESVSREVKMYTNYVADQRIKAAIVVEPASERRVMSLFVNGNRVASDLYDSAYTFANGADGITLDASEADLYVETIRIYDRALSEDEELENWIVDLPVAEMSTAVKDNDILDESGRYVDITKLISKGKGTLRIIRTNKLDDVYAANDKKKDFLADIEFRSPFGREYDFVLYNCYIRIQGTSSTKYPSKNIRIYMNKGESPQLVVNGTVAASPNLYVMRPGAKPMNLYCLKSDSVDSSMSLNTGGAKLFNDTLINLGLLTPPQQAQLDAGEDISVRTAIDGFPIDVFVSESWEGTADYVGQYNFNNEKSKSSALFGMDDGDIALEALNNTNACCLFSTSSNQQLAEQFDLGFEFNHPEDLTWATASAEQRSVVTTTHEWLRSCVPSGADPNNISTYKSATFKAGVSNYFNLPFLLAYYAFTDYFLSVDQRAKNILWRIWDGIWYATYYDGDTSMGKANDGFMAYGYDTTRDTWDSQRQKYAFEGHDSVLWCLLLANLSDELAEMAQRMRRYLTKERVKAMLIDEQSGNWSNRASNRSGEVKYIRPAVTETYGKIWPFIFMLQGLNKEGRKYFIDNRFALLDAKYGCDEYREDSVELYMARTESDAPDRVTVKASEPYAFGYSRKNGTMIANTGIVGAGESANVEIAVALTTNDPISLHGASRMAELDLTGAASHLKNTLDLAKCQALRRLTLDSADGVGSTGWNIALGGCSAIRSLSARGQRSFTTSTGAAHVANLEPLTKLEYVDLRESDVESLTFAEGAPLQEAHLPGTLSTLRLRYLHKLNEEGLDIASLANVKSLDVAGCEGIDEKSLLESWLDECALPKAQMSLSMEGVDWSGVDVEWLLSLNALAKVSLTGRIALSARPTSAQCEAIMEMLGDGVFVDGNPLRVTAPGGFVIVGETNITEGSETTVSVCAMAENVQDVTITAEPSTSSVFAEVDAAKQTVRIWSTETGTNRSCKISVSGDGAASATYTVWIAAKTYPSNFTVDYKEICSPGESTSVTVLPSGSGYSGAYEMRWELGGDAAANVSIVNSNNEDCLLSIGGDITDSSFTLTATALKAGTDAQLWSQTVTFFVVAGAIIMTADSNPIFMEYCHSSGWAASDKFMTKSEAEAVTSEISIQGAVIPCLDELRYFNVPSIYLKNVTCNTITLPPTLTKISRCSGVTVNSQLTILGRITSIDNTSMSSGNSFSDIYVPGNEAPSYLYNLLYIATKVDTIYVYKEAVVLQVVVDKAQELGGSFSYTL